MARRNVHRRLTALERQSGTQIPEKLLYLCFGTSDDEARSSNSGTAWVRVSDETPLDFQRRVLTDEAKKCPNNLLVFEVGPSGGRSA